MLARVVSWIAHQRLTDTTSGFQALNRRAIRLFAADLPHDYPEVEGLVMAIRHQLRVKEVPVTMREREHGRSSIGVARLRLLHDQGAARASSSTSSAATSFPRRTHDSASGSRSSRPVVAVVLLLVVFELIRSRRLRERYALLWLATGLVLVVLSAWRGGLNTIAGWLGVRSYPPAVLFAVGLLFVILVLLHYSTVISRLADQNTILAQRLALLESRLPDREGPSPTTLKPCAMPDPRRCRLVEIRAGTQSMTCQHWSDPFAGCESIQPRAGRDRHQLRRRRQRDAERAVPVAALEVNGAEREHAGPERGRKNRRPGDERPVTPSQAEHDQCHRPPPAISAAGSIQEMSLSAEPRDAGGACRGDCGEPVHDRAEGRPSGGSAHAASAAGTSQIRREDEAGIGRGQEPRDEDRERGTTTASIGHTRAGAARVACRRGHE